MEPMCSAFQEDVKCYEEGVDFMFGDSLLVANVVEKGQTVRPVYLPRTENENERFYNFYTREEYAPGQTIEVPVDISSIPLFVRSGAILPMSGNRLHNLMTEKTTELEILMAPDVDSEFVLYEDDGCTNEYLKGAYLKTRIAVRRKDLRSLYQRGRLRYRCGKHVSGYDPPRKIPVLCAAGRQGAAALPAPPQV